MILRHTSESERRAARVVIAHLVPDSVGESCGAIIVGGIDVRARVHQEVDDSGKVVRELVVTGGLVGGDDDGGVALRGKRDMLGRRGSLSCWLARDSFRGQLALLLACGMFWGGEGGGYRLGVDSVDVSALRDGLLDRVRVALAGGVENLDVHGG